MRPKLTLTADSTDDSLGSFVILCTVTGALTNVVSAPCFLPNQDGTPGPPDYALVAGKRKGKKRKGQASKPAPKPAYYMQSVDVVLSFGLTELKAELAWKRNVSLIHSRSALHLLTIPYETSCRV